MDIELGSVADWASAFGSVLAAVVALYLAHASQRVRLAVVCGIRIIVDDQKPLVRIAAITVTNTGDRQFKVSNISIRHGIFKKKHGIIKIGAPSEHCESLLRALNDGDQALYGFPLESPGNWVVAMGSSCRTWIDIATLRITIHCSNGQSKTIKPEKLLLDEIRVHMHKSRKIEVTHV